MADAKVISFINGSYHPGADIIIPMDSTGQFSGDLTFIADTEKINQDVVKGLLTEYGSDYLAPRYGTTLSALLHSRKLNNVSNSISSEVQILLGYIARFNEDQPLSEQLAELVDLQAEEGISSISLKIVVKNGSGTITTITI